MRKLKAFTLAEVLITLGVIGVVAALTIPTLMQKMDERETVSKVQKIYSTLTNAIKLAEAEHGDVKTWGTDTNAEYDGKFGMDLGQEPSTFYLLDNLKIIKECSGSNCFADSYTDAWGNPNNPDPNYSFLLADGTIIGVEGDVFSDFWVDLNGKKGPNKYGADIFRFHSGGYDSYVKNKQFAYSALSCADSASKSDQFDEYGLCEFGWILKYGNMDYLD
ncbi:type II secretion system protein [bacterium]|nr:type II secretion system protein [bacterium]